MKRNKLIGNDFSCPLAVDKVEQEILGYIKSGKAVRSQRLLPERNLAKHFKVSQYTVHRAVARLVERGLLYSQVGRGVFVRDRSQLGMVEKSRFYTEVGGGKDWTMELRARRLEVRLSSSLDEDQRNMWQKVFTAFHQEFPFLQVHVQYEDMAGDVADDADILILGLHEIPGQRHQLRPVQIKNKGLLSEMFKADDLSPGLLEMGQFGNNLCAIPLLRVTSMIFAHRGVFQRCGIGVETIRKPVDLFRAGAEIEDRLKGSIVGLFYRGLVYHAMLAGISFSRQGNRLDFDGPGLKAFLEEVRPFIRSHHYSYFNMPSLRDLLSGQCAILPDYAFWYPELVNDTTKMAPLRIPLAEGGCVCETCFMGGVSRHSSYPDDAVCLLHFMAGKKAQEIICHQHPQWLSVRKDVLEWQKAHSPFPEGAVHYDFNPCGCRHLKDPLLFNDGIEHMNLEVMKYFKGLQGIDETLEKMKCFPLVKTRRRTSTRTK